MGEKRALSLPRALPLCPSWSRPALGTPEHARSGSFSSSSCQHHGNANVMNHVLLYNERIKHKILTVNFLTYTRRTPRGRQCCKKGCGASTTHHYIILNFLCIATNTLNIKVTFKQFLNQNGTEMAFFFFLNFFSTKHFRGASWA